MSNVRYNIVDCRIRRLDDWCARHPVVGYVLAALVLVSLGLCLSYLSVQWVDTSLTEMGY